MPNKALNPTFASNAWVRDLEASMTEKSLLYALATRVGPEYKAWPSRKRLAKDAGIKSISTVSKALHSLEKKGLIQITKVIGKDGSQKSNLYRLLVPPQYKSDSPPSVSSAGGSAADSLKLSSTNCPMDYPVGIDKQKDEIGDATASQLQSSEIDKGKPVDGFPVSARYIKNLKSAKAKVSFWWELQQVYRPDAFTPQKSLTKYQFNALIELTSIFEDPLTALQVIEVVIREWYQVVKFAKYREYMGSAPQQPTTTWILKNINSCAQYYSEKL